MIGLNQLFGGTYCRRLEPAFSTDSFDQVLRVRVQNVFEVPSDQKVDPVNSGEGDMRSISRLRFRHRLTIDESVGQGLCIWIRRQQRNPVNHCQPICGCVWVAGTAFGDYQVGDP
ncbi:MAG: hypothetical protein DWQ45_09840 [Planctomycetota bacterium]|nr:MAG: hypothetical protein DWQ45_09840 [Planctomycetota bacterium]